MSSPLVSLEVKQPQWEKASDEVFIGKDILELLSTSMYVEPLSMYREYVQNAADSLDHARERNSVSDSAFDVQVTIDRQQRSIKIRDAGPGLAQEQFYRRLTSIGGSSKRGTKARGFRGVGRLAGLAFCQELIFRTRSLHSRHVEELRWDTRKVRTLLRAAERDMSLATIVAECVERRRVAAVDVPEHFFEVELRNVMRHRDDRLLNSVEVMNYLGQVAPVPFHPDFSFGREITEFLSHAGVHLRPLVIDVVGEGPVYKPHRDQIESGGKQIKMHKVETFTTLDREGEPAAASWILHHDYIGSLAKGTQVNGWRLRSGDIQVGDNTIVEDLFPESRFNGWAIAETHVLDRKVVPNGRRDNYEHSAHFSDLQTRLTPHARDIAHHCRTSSILRTTTQRLEADLARTEEKVTIAQKPRTPSFVIASLKGELASSLPNLQKLTAKSLFDNQEGERFRARVRKLTTRIETLGAAELDDPVKDFPTAQQEVLRQVIEAIHVIEGQTERADKLVGKILARLRRQRAGKA